MALLRRLRDEAEGLAGELVLGHLCEAAQVTVCSRPAKELCEAFNGVSGGKALAKAGISEQ